MKLTKFLYRSLVVLFIINVIILFFFFFSSRRRHTIFSRDWSSDVCSSDLPRGANAEKSGAGHGRIWVKWENYPDTPVPCAGFFGVCAAGGSALYQTLEHRFMATNLPRRSEERRVGKECRVVEGVDQY